VASTVLMWRERGALHAITGADGRTCADDEEAGVRQQIGMLRPRRPNLDRVMPISARPRAIAAIASSSRRTAPGG